MVLDSAPYHSRDLNAAIDLYLAGRRAEILDDWLTAAAARRLLAATGLSPERSARLWRDERGRLVGLARARDPGPAFVAVDPTVPPADVLGPIVDWLVEQRRLANGSQGKAEPLTIGWRDDAPDYVAFFDQRGFTREPDSTLLLRRSLVDPIPDPILPNGFTIRPLQGEAEVEAYVALHREAFGTQLMTVPGRQDLLADPDYVPEIDLVAVAPDGILAAFVRGWIEGEMNLRLGRREAWTDPVGTRPAYRRLGLSRALFHASFRLLRERGITVAKLSTGSWNAVGRAAFHAVGFRLAYRAIRFTRRLGE